MDFNEIKQFPHSNYYEDVDFRRLESFIKERIEEGLDIEPDYQRAHRWTEEQQRLYIEYMLKGGELSRTLIVNAPDFDRKGYEGATLLDGKQRLQAIMKFMRNELTVFDGNRLSDFTGYIRMFAGRIRWTVVCLSTRLEVIDLYLAINTRGTPHTPEEIERVQQLRDEAALANT